MNRMKNKKVTNLPFSCLYTVFTGSNQCWKSLKIILTFFEKLKLLGNYNFNKWIYNIYNTLKCTLQIYKYYLYKIKTIIYIIYTKLKQ